MDTVGCFSASEQLFRSYSSMAGSVSLAELAETEAQIVRKSL
jgi:hypothetical protein